MQQPPISVKRTVEFLSTHKTGDCWAVKSDLGQKYS